MIIFGYYIIHLDWNVYLKFWVIVLITFGGSFLFYELFIKRFNMMRLLFGMKSKKSKIKTASYKSAEDII